MTHRGRSRPSVMTHVKGCGMASLRERLRADTAPLHDQVDRAFSQLDLREKAPLVCFLQAQGAALRAIRCRQGTDAPVAEALRQEMFGAIGADLRHLGACGPNALKPVELDATAVLYALLGSQMGLRVLRQRWAASSDSVVAGAGHSFGLTPRTLAWRHLCNELAARPADDSSADAIIRDAGRIFGLYLAGFELAMEPGGQYPSLADHRGV